MKWLMGRNTTERRESQVQIKRVVKMGKQQSELEKAIYWEETKEVIRAFAGIPVLTSVQVLASSIDDS